MGGRVPFLVAKRIVERNNLLQSLDDICPHIRVSPFIDGQAGGGMGIKEVADSLFYPCLVHSFLHLAGDVNEVHVLVGLD